MALDPKEGLALWGSLLALIVICIFLTVWISVIHNEVKRLRDKLEEFQTNVWRHGALR